MADRKSSRGAPPTVSARWDRPVVPTHLSSSQALCLCPEAAHDGASEDGVPALDLALILLAALETSPSAPRSGPTHRGVCDGVGE